MKLDNKRNTDQVGQMALHAAINYDLVWFMRCAEIPISDQAGKIREAACKSAAIALGRYTEMDYTTFLKIKTRVRKMNKILDDWTEIETYLPEWDEW